jgi:hypothetical protein
MNPTHLRSSVVICKSITKAYVTGNEGIYVARWPNCDTNYGASNAALLEGRFGKLWKSGAIHPQNQVQTFQKADS